MDKWKKKTTRAFVICMLCFVIVALYGYVDNFVIAQEMESENKMDEWDVLNDLAEQALKLVQNEKFPSARNVVLQLEDLYLSLAVGTYVDRLEQASLLSDTIIQARHRFGSGRAKSSAH